MTMMRTKRPLREPVREVPGPKLKNYITPAGLQRLRDEHRFLMTRERPAVTAVVAWAAGNGDRSENGDYIYNKKRLREIDRRARYLTKRLESAEVVDPQRQRDLEQVFFGATVSYTGDDGVLHTVTLVGIDEADLAHGKINWQSPVAKALLKSRPGDRVRLQSPAGATTVEIVAVRYTE